MALMRYRLALDLGSTSLGWAMIRLNAENNPCAIIKAGVRLFNNGRDPKTEASLAVSRREARAIRRRRDRLLKRKERMLKKLVDYGFFPANAAERKKLETLNPYALRAKGLDAALTPEEFARALFHINQRRGFKSNRKTDKADNDSGALKTAIATLREKLTADNCRTVGEWLHRRDTAGHTVRARMRQTSTVRADGKNKIDKAYDLYIDRAMIEAEFDALWAKQSALNPALFTSNAHDDLKDALLFQRQLKPVKPGRCTLMPNEERAPLALPSTQRFRIYQEVNNLRILREGLKEEPLTLQQRDELVAALEANSKRTFKQIKNLLGVGGAVQFNFEDPKRQELKGNTTNAILGSDKCFGDAWFSWSEAQQDAVVMQLVTEQNEATLIRWLQAETGVDEKTAERVANVGLPEGYGSLCAQALARILPMLREADPQGGLRTYDKAVQAAGFDHHSRLTAFGEVPGHTFDTGIERIDPQTGEVQHLHAFKALPYYGEFLQRHVGFGSGKPEDSEEKRFGKIANPTVHIGLNQIRKVVNALIARYGHPSEIIIELARDLKQSKVQRDEESKRQADNQKRNMRLRADAAGTMGISEERVRHADIQKMILWEELNPKDIADRKCPYSGVQISARMLLSDEVEIEHILPFSQTLDDSLNNKTVALRRANRVKGNRTPWDARDDFEAQGWSYEHMVQRAEQMPKAKRYRFSEGAIEKWLKEDAGFLARALNDTRHMSKVAKAYLELICPQNTRAIPGGMTAMLRGKFGLNDVLGLDGEKNRNDHRHHAVDACVIGVTDQGLLQRFASASADAREKSLNRLVEDMPLPWSSYREQVARAVSHIWVSHKPDHGYEGAMHEDTAWGLRADGQASRRVRGEDGIRHRETKHRSVIPLSSTRDPQRHGQDAQGQPASYKGYVGGSNFCIDIVCNEKGKWEGEVVSTFSAYQLVRSLEKELGKEAGLQKALARLRSKTVSISGKPLAMRLQNGDMVKMEVEDKLQLMRVVKIDSQGKITLAAHQEANVNVRDGDKDDAFKYTYKTAGSLQKAKGRRVTISPIGELRDPGFQG